MKKRSTGDNSNAYQYAEMAIKRAFSECPNLALLISSLLKSPLYDLFRTCRLTLGVPVSPMYEHEYSLFAQRLSIVNTLYIYIHTYIQVGEADEGDRGSAASLVRSRLYDGVQVRWGESAGPSDRGTNSIRSVGNHFLYALVVQHRVNDNATSCRSGHPS